MEEWGNLFYFDYEWRLLLNGKSEVLGADFKEVFIKLESQGWKLVIRLNDCDYVMKRIIK